MEKDKIIPLGVFNEVSFNTSRHWFPLEPSSPETKDPGGGGMADPLILCSFPH